MTRVCQHFDKEYEYCTNHGGGEQDTRPYNEGEKDFHERSGWFLVKEMVVAGRYYRLWRKRLDWDKF